MEKHTKWAGIAMVVGGLLMFTRMAPIFAVLPEDMAFPPETTEEMIRLATVAGSRWQLSHIMGLAAVVLFAIAYGLHSRILTGRGWRRLGLGVVTISTMAFGLFAIALVIDGFVVPATIDGYVSANGSDPITLEQVAESHRLALRYFAPGLFLVFVTMGLLSVPMLYRSIHSRWLGVIGQIVAVLAVGAYMTGIAGSNWDNMQVAGTLMMAMFAWHLLVGTRALFARSRERQDEG